MSTYQWLGLPGEISVTVFMVALSIALAPYFGGAELGPVKIPRFSHKTTASLKRLGWLPLLLVTAAFYPLWPGGDDKKEPTGPFSVTIKLESEHGTLDCARLTGANVVLSLADDAPRGAVAQACTATISSIPEKYQNGQGWISLVGGRGFVRSDDDAFRIERNATLHAKLEPATEVPRVHVAVLPYQVPDPAAQSQFQQFRDALANRIFAISQSFSSRGAAFEYVDRLKLFNDGPSLASAAELRSFWDDSHSLQLVRGQLESARQPPTVRSLIYLGDLAPAPEHSGVQLDMPVTADSFSRNQDSYSVVMLYALARDAQRTKRPKDVVVAFLSEAFAICRQLDPSAGDVAPIKNAIQTLLGDLSASQ